MNDFGNQFSQVIVHVIEDAFLATTKIVDSRVSYA